MSTQITVEELLEVEGFDDLIDLLEDCEFGIRNYPALCSEGCEVEPDGTCEHGNPSVGFELWKL